MWIESDNKLIREFKFNDFEEAISFINKVAEISERDKVKKGFSFMNKNELPPKP